MRIGETKQATIHARPLWNHTGVTLTVGETYRFSATGRWVDWFIEHGPEGSPSASFYMRLFECCRRVSDADWFTLIGAVGTDLDTAFVIGTGGTHKAKHTGELTCFANDVALFYWNNDGQVSLSITRVE